MPSEVPMRVMVIPPPVGPFCGLRLVMVGALYEKNMVSETCVAAVTCTSLFVPSPAGSRHTSRVCGMRERTGQLSPPTVAVAKKPKSVPGDSHTSARLTSNADSKLVKEHEMAYRSA